MSYLGNLCSLYPQPSRLQLHPLCLSGKPHNRPTQTLPLPSASSWGSKRRYFLLEGLRGRDQLPTRGCRTERRLPWCCSSGDTWGAGRGSLLKLLGGMTGPRNVQWKGTFGFRHAWTLAFIWLGPQGSTPEAHIASQDPERLDLGPTQVQFTLTSSALGRSRLCRGSGSEHFCLHLAGPRG